MTTIDIKENGSNRLLTYFATAERLNDDELQEQLESLDCDLVINALLKSFGTLVAVLNEHRQILAVNDGLLQFLGIKDATHLLGLRPGEALSCVHSEDHPGGCGTSKFCSTCGAAIAIVLSQKNSLPEERECLLTVSDQEIDLELKVRAEPFEINNHKLILLMLVDIREEKKRQALERVFFHDLNNILSSLVWTAKLMEMEEPENIKEHVETISRLVRQISDEVRCQQILSLSDSKKYSLESAQYSVNEILNDIRFFLSNSIASGALCLNIIPVTTRAYFHTDKTLLFKILINMITNAMEASEPGQEVRLWCDVEDDSLCWNVWNHQAISEKNAMRIFQRYFSTKKKPGHGLGTFSMKLFGEHYLRGKVTFKSTEREGTTFSFRHPIKLS